MTDGTGSDQGETRAATASGPAGGRAGPDNGDRRARVWLCRAVEPGRGSIYRFVRAAGSEAVMAKLRDAVEQDSRRRSVRLDEDRIDDDLVAATEHGFRFIIPADAEWPGPQLRPLELATAAAVAGPGEREDQLAPPLGLWVRGELPVSDAVERAVAIVGSRAATAYGEHVASELAYGLAERGWTVISGGAVGIDAAAHRGALTAGGTTIAMLAGGLDVPYPRGHRGLFDRIAGSGLLLSEWPPGCASLRHRFLVRNRLIAGLAAGTVVVEAGVRSGALATANRANTFGRPVMVVPGPVTSAMSVGGNELIRRQEASLVTRVEEVIETVGRIGADLAPARTAEPGPRDGLDPLAARVLDGVPVAQPAGVEGIARVAGVAPGDVLKVLPVLELRGLTERAATGWRLSALARRADRAS